MARRLAWPASVRRWRRWIVVLGILLLIRAALPFVLRPLLVWQASKALQAQVEIGDVDLALYRCGIALKNVQIRSANTQSSHEDVPLIAWKRLAVAVRWLPLFKKRVLLREFILEGPGVAVDREEDGQINLLALVPASGAPPTPSPAPPETSSGRGSGWTLGVDQLVLRDGNLRFRDFKAKGSPPLFLNLQSLQLTDIALQPGVYREPAQLQVALTVEGGSLTLRGRLTRGEDGQALEAGVDAHNIPLQRVPYYVHAVGWRTLDASLDGQLAYRFDSKGQNQVRGTLGLRDVVIRVPNVEEPALTYRRLTLKLDPLDLTAQRVHVSALEVEGATIFVGRPGGDRMPLLLAVKPDSAAAASAPAGSVPSPTPSSPWHWSLARMRIADSHIRLLRAEAPLDVVVDVTASDLADGAEQPGQVRIVATVGKGSVTVDGGLRLSRLGFAGTLRAAAFPLSEVLSAIAIPPADLLQAAELEAQLTVEAGLSTAPPGDGELAPADVRVRGHVSLSGFGVANPGSHDFLLQAKSVDVGIDQLTVPGVLPGADAGDAGRPLRVALGEVQIVGLKAKVTRTADGIALSILPAAAAPAAVIVPAPVKEGGSAAPEAAKESAPARPVEVTLETLRLRDANLALVDLTVKPVFDGTIAPLAIDARGIRWPGPVVKDLRITGTTQRGKISISGALDHNKGRFDVNTEGLALLPFNPYATTLAGYRIGNGRASVTTKVTITDGRYDARNALTLHDLDVRGADGESLFQRTFGLPLSMALALMRDPNGDIALEIPLQIDRDGLRVGIGAVILGAIKQAIIGALTAPLKLLGAMFGGGGKVDSVPPTLIAFRPGHDELMPEGTERAEQLAALLASRPALGVTLTTAVTESDVRWLREQALRAAWEKEGFFKKLQDLPQRSARKAVSRALEARARGEEGKLDPEDAAALDGWLDERPPPPAAQLRALAEARLARIEQVLREGRGIDSQRVRRGEIPEGTAADAPAVSLELGPVA